MGKKCIADTLSEMTKLKFVFVCTKNCEEDHLNIISNK